MIWQLLVCSGSIATNKRINATNTAKNIIHKLFLLVIFYLYLPKTKKT